MDGGACRLQTVGSPELDTTERLHFHFSLSCIGEGNGNPLQCSCLENPRDGGAWWAAIYGVAQSRTRLKWCSSSSSSVYEDVMSRVWESHFWLSWDHGMILIFGVLSSGMIWSRTLDEKVWVSCWFWRPRCLGWLLRLTLSPSCGKDVQFRKSVLFLNRGMGSIDFFAFEA